MRPAVKRNNPNRRSMPPLGAREDKENELPLPPMPSIDADPVPKLGPKPVKSSKYARRLMGSPVGMGENYGPLYTTTNTQYYHTSGAASPKGRKVFAAQQ